MSPKAFTLRLPKGVYEELAKRKKSSVSQYVLEAIEEKLAKDREQELRAGLANLAPGPDPDEVQPWLDAQRSTMGQVDA